MGVRVMLGKLDAITGIVGDFGLLVKRGILGTGTTTTIDDDGLAVTTGGVERVRVGAIGGGDYGLKVVNAGSTVIIDGTSNMFKIAATGTQSIATVNGDRDVNTGVTLSGLGAFATTPAWLAMMGDSNTSGAKRYGPFAHMVVTGNMWVATSSGGSPTNEVIHINGWWAWTYVYLDGSSFVNIQITSSNQSGAGHTAYQRYYVLLETAI